METAERRGILKGMSTQWKDRISDDQSRPKLRESGLSVEAVLDALAEGWSRERIREAQPSVSDEDLRACIAYAAEKVRKEVLLRLIREGEDDVAAGRVTPDEELDAIFGPLDEDDDE